MRKISFWAANPIKEKITIVKPNGQKITFTAITKKFRGGAEV